MNKPKYTPGPWRFDGEVGIVAPSGWVLAIVYRRDPPRLPATRMDWDAVKDEAKANARLIAAAPELLEACKLLAALENDSIDSYTMFKFGPAYLAALEAITKAEGNEE